MAKKNKKTCENFNYRIFRVDEEASKGRYRRPKKITMKRIYAEDADAAYGQEQHCRYQCLGFHFANSLAMSFCRDGDSEILQVFLIHGCSSLVSAGRSLRL